MPDLDQLDPRLGAAFEHIARDISGSSVPPGARTAIRTSRRRRGALAGSVAVLALVAGGVAVGQFLPGDPTAGIAQRGDGVASDARPLPDPAPFTAESFNDATDGWTGPWQDWEPGSPMLDEEDSCFVTALEKTDPDWGVAIPAPDRVGYYELTADAGGSAVMQFHLFGSAADAGSLYTQVHDMLSTCEPYSAGTGFAYEGPDDVGEGVAAVVEDGGKVAVTVIARVSDRVSFGHLVAPAEAGVPGEPVLERVADTLAAGLQDDSLYQHDLTASDDAAEGPDSIFPPPPAQLAQALEGWETDWEPEGRPQEIGSPPCLPADSWVAVDDGDGAGANRRVAGGGTYGTTGEIDYAGWQSREHAESAWAVIAESLETCQSTQWAITETTTEMGNEGLWATHDGGTVFAIHYNRDVAVLYLAGESDPPAEVADAVLLELSNKIMIFGL